MDQNRNYLFLEYGLLQNASSIEGVNTMTMKTFAIFCRPGLDRRSLEDRLESSSQRMTSGKAGFSLVELMTVVSITAVMGTISLTSVESFNRVLHKAPIEQVMADLRLARAMAASEKRDVQITFKNNEHEYSIWVDRNDNGNVDSGETELTILGSKGITLFASPNTGTFRPDGTFVTGSSHLYVGVNTPSGYTSLYISPSGHADMLDGDS